MAYSIQPVSAYGHPQPQFLLRLCREIIQDVLVDNHLRLSPNHLVHHTDVTLDDADDLGGDVLVHVVGDRDAREAVADEGDGDVDTLEKADGVDAAEHEAAFVQGLGALGRCTDADGRERMADAREE